MKIKMIKVVDRGTHQSEKVIMNVVQDTNLINYILRDTTYLKENTISNRWVHAYEFLKQDVKKGDQIILYTKVGINSKKDLGSGCTEYTYYWCLNSSVWNNDGDAAVLYEVEDWQHMAVNTK